jgi:hypothetical protein
MRRRWLLAWVLFGCLALTLLLPLGPLLRDSYLDREHFETLQVGMARPEVEQILGGPPRNECPAPADVWVRRGGKLQSAGIEPGTPAVGFFADATAVEDDEELVWVGEAGLIAARFGGDGRLREKYFSTVQSAGRPGLRDVVRRFGW